MIARLTHMGLYAWGLPWNESFFRFRDTKRSSMNGTAKESGKQEVLVVASREFKRGLIPVCERRHMSARVVVRLV